MLNNPYIFYGLIFTAVLLIIDTSLRYLASRQRSRADVRNRLEGLRQKEGVEEAFGELLKRRGLGGRNGQQSVGTRLNQYIAQTGREISTTRRIFYFMGLWIIGFVFAFLVITTNFVAQLISATIIACILGFAIIYYLRSRQIWAFTQQLAPALDIIVRSLNSGHPLVTAIALVAREMPDPIGSEFGILSDQMTFGSELEQAMLNMYDRVGAAELNMITVSVSVQQGTGGNLAEILANLSQMIRDRLMMKAKIKAISAEGRITAWIMLLFPFGLFFMLKAMVPTYFDLVWESGYGGVVVGTCLALIFFGMIVIRRLVNFDY